MHILQQRSKFNVMKTKFTTLLIIFFLGFAGVHDFYLKKRPEFGLIKLIMFLNITTLVLLPDVDVASPPNSFVFWFWAGCISVFWIIDFFRFAAMGSGFFNYRYNHKKYD